MRKFDNVYPQNFQFKKNENLIKAKLTGEFRVGVLL